MAEEKKPAPKQSKKPVVQEKEAKKPTAAKKPLCSHKSRKELGKGEILEELSVNSKDCYRIKFENLKNNIVFKKEEIIKE